MQCYLEGTGDSSAFAAEIEQQQDQVLVKWAMPTARQAQCLQGSVDVQCILTLKDFRNKDI